MRLICLLLSLLCNAGLANGQDVAVIAEKEAAVARATGMDAAVLREAITAASHGDTKASLRLVREGSVNGEAQWDEWNALIEAHGVFDSKGRCKPAPISVLSPVAADCWGSFFIVWDLLKEARKFVAPEAGVAPFHECIILHGPGRGLLRRTVDAMVEQYESSKGPEGEFHAQFLGGLLRTVNSNRLRMIKILVSSNHTESLAWLGGNCGSNLVSTFATASTVTGSSIQDLMFQCLMHQNMLTEGLDHQIKGLDHGYQLPTALDAAAVFGSETLMRYILSVTPRNKAPLPEGSTSPLHTAVHQGWPEVIARLIKQGYDPMQKDPYGCQIRQLPLQNTLTTTCSGHRAIDIACMQRWTMAEIKSSFGDGAYAFCREGDGGPQEYEKKEPTVPYFFEGPGGGYTSSYVPGRQHFAQDLNAAMIGEAEPSSCDFDVWDSGPFSEKLFVERYVAPHRPVLIRGLLKGEQAEQLKANWSVANIVETHPDVTFTASGIPYAEQFGLGESESDAQMRQVTIQQYLDFMKKMQDETTMDVFEDDSALPYIFSSIENEALLMTSLGQNIARIEIPIVQFGTKTGSRRMHEFKAQFYLGAIGTGAPLHSHVHAYNILVHGRKQWYVAPPRHGLYSREPIRNWVSSSYSSMLKSGATVYECIQEPGDVLYVPEMWAHGVVNLAESVGIAMEFSLKAHKNEKLDVNDFVHKPAGADSGSGTQEAKAGREEL